MRLTWLLFILTIITLQDVITARHEAVKETEGSVEHSEEHRAHSESPEKAGEEDEGFGVGEIEHVRQRDVGIASMLLGSVGFVMILFYLVNWSDDDIRRYSWCIISTTVSIFAAVLSFNGFMAMVEAILPATKDNQMLMAYGTFVVLFLLLQGMVMTVSGAYVHWQTATQDLEHQAWQIADNLRSDFGQTVDESCVREKKAGRSVALIENVEVFVHKRKVNYESADRYLKSWGVLLSHLTGFAAIRAGGYMQHLEVFAASPGMAFIPVVLSQVILSGLFRLGDVFRHLTIKHPETECVEMCKEELTEGENDITGIASSFLVTQVIRFAVTGVLANVEGLEEPYTRRGLKIVLWLWIIGLCSLMIALSLYCIPSRMLSDRKVLHALQTIQNTLGMVFAWAVLFCSRDFSEESDFMKRNFDAYPEEKQLVLALFLSMMALLVIGVLDKIQDSQVGSRQRQRDVARVLQNMINILSLVIGLSWEACFSTGLEELAEEASRPLTMKLMFTACTLVVVLPAWRRYILARVMVLEQLHLEKAQAKDKIAEERNLLIAKAELQK